MNQRFSSDPAINAHMKRMSEKGAGAAEIFMTAPAGSALAKINALALKLIDRDGTLDHATAVNRVLLSPGGAALYQEYVDEKVG